jgi:hypothetical protein
MSKGPRHPTRRGVGTQVTVPMISASVGKRPLAFFEKINLSSTRISNTPPPEHRSVTRAPGLDFFIRFAASRARGS